MQTVNLILVHGLNGVMLQWLRHLLLRHTDMIMIPYRLK